MLPKRIIINGKFLSTLRGMIRERVVPLYLYTGMTRTNILASVQECYQYFDFCALKGEVCRNLGLWLVVHSDPVFCFCFIEGMDGDFFGFLSQY